ncbi:MAG: CRISPR system Cascade subunit CasD [Rubritalea sp.]|jgi:CRISPR system Cascade subunit CasD
MKTLILKTEGMSSYGLQTFDVQRKSNHFPTRSAVLGLLAAASGINRDQPDVLFALSQQLSIAVQVTNAGQKIIDYHTVQNFRSPNGKIQKGVKPTYREYWCDSAHSFAITGPEKLIDDLSADVKSPVYGLFQGRKSCPLTRPLFECVLNESNPVKALHAIAEHGQIYSDVDGEGRVAMLQVRDLTTSRHRRFAIRKVYICSTKGASDESTNG